MNELSRIHLNGLRAVEAVAREGSLAGAAALLGVTPGAVSQHVRRAEAQLGCTLFDRGAGHLVPTPLGAEVADELGRGFGLLAAAVRRARQAGQGTLTVSVAPIFASKWLVWRVQDFAAAHPELSLRIDAAVEMVDLDRSDTDLAIRVGRGPWRGVRAERLARQYVFPVCSPALAERPLAEIPMLVDRNGPDWWAAWRQASGNAEPAGPPGPVYSDGALCLDAAIAGQGVFLAWPTLAGDAIARGQLVIARPGVLDTGASYWMVTRAGEPRLPPKCAAFAAWLRAALAESHAALGLETS
ncbi:LysR substrate-binding domain-containing protein [Pontivivens ytuae]|uniref:LysR family transcriptional regulator n=1 Tax=Pontivivens ytuae TaxID=2789856 RepID=A0A7S9LS89_9RHOB|nr:LysR substrate-binding domain-containing protein [Pontivivens ytuae]QPH54361.1 LysR family transcriptional regulator [Pontivivens ytuae]